MKYLEEQDVIIINGDEMRKIQHALWMARTECAMWKADFFRAFINDYRKWKWVERKCLAKAKEFE